MRLITWNCCRGDHSKLAPLFDLRPDIAIVQETPQPTTALADDQVWLGDNQHQGLLVLSFRGWRLDSSIQRRPGADYFLPVRVHRGGQQFNLLAAWVKKGTEYPLYTSSIRRALDLYQDFLSHAPAVIAGDLNSYCHEDICDRFGLVSAYHEFFGVEFDSEKHATHYFRRQRSPGYHFDYCFIPRQWRRRLRDVRVGTYRQWVRRSDHAPLIVDVSVPRGPNQAMERTATGRAFTSHGSSMRSLRATRVLGGRRSSPSR